MMAGTLRAGNKHSACRVHNLVTKGVGEGKPAPNMAGTADEDAPNKAPDPVGN
jgi:hypothetical protein